LLTLIDPLRKMCIYLHHIQVSSLALTAISPKMLSWRFRSRKR